MNVQQKSFRHTICMTYVCMYVQYHMYVYVELGTSVFMYVTQFAKTRNNPAFSKIEIFVFF